MVNNEVFKFFTAFLVLCRVHISTPHLHRLLDRQKNTASRFLLHNQFVGFRKRLPFCDNGTSNYREKCGGGGGGWGPLTLTHEGNDD